MNPSPETPASKPSVEALLRLKRAERPDEAFWADFEIGMRQKQLAAIIEPKPWWLGAALALRRFSVPALVVSSGAAALLAFTVVRNGSPLSDAGFTTAAVSVPAVTDAKDASVVAAPSIASSVLSVVLHPLEEVVPVISENDAPVLMAVVEPTASSVLVELLPEVLESESPALVANTDLPTSVVEAAPASPELFEVTARNFASVSWQNERVTVEDGDFADLASIPMATYAFNPSVVGALIEPEEVVIPAAVAPAPGSRFERLLADDASKVAANSNGSLAQVRDRVLHHLGRDEELYASVSRLGVGGDRLSLRF